MNSSVAHLHLHKVAQMRVCKLHSCYSSSVKPIIFIAEETIHSWVSTNNTVTTAAQTWLKRRLKPSSVQIMRTAFINFHIQCSCYILSDLCNISVMWFNVYCLYIRVQVMLRNDNNVIITSDRSNTKQTVLTVACDFSNLRLIFAMQLQQKMQLSTDYCKTQLLST